MRLVVVTTRALADGFRLAGAATVVADPGADAVSIVHALVAHPAVGLIMVTHELWQSVPERSRASLESLARPIVLGIPTGAGEGPGAGAGGRMAGEALSRAIGHRIGLPRNARRTGGSP